MWPVSLGCPKALNWACSFMGLDCIKSAEVCCLNHIIMGLIKSKDSIRTAKCVEERTVCIYGFCRVTSSLRLRRKHQRICIWWKCFSMTVKLSTGAYHWGEEAACVCLCLFCSIVIVGLRQMLSKHFLPRQSVTVLTDRSGKQNRSWMVKDVSHLFLFFYAFWLVRLLMVNFTNGPFTEVIFSFCCWRGKGVYGQMVPCL